MGRPMKEPLERRSAKLPPIRVTEAELALVYLQADRAGLSVTELVRQRTLMGRLAPRRGMADAHLLSELNRIGVNLNQIARALNRGQDLPMDAADVLAELHRVLNLVGSAYGS